MSDDGFEEWDAEFLDQLIQVEELALSSSSSYNPTQHHSRPLPSPPPQPYDAVSYSTPRETNDYLKPKGFNRSSIGSQEGAVSSVPYLHRSDNSKELEIDRLKDEREVLPPNSETTGATNVVGVVPATTHGIEVAVEHPTEPLDNDRPIQCPLPEPSILNDGRIWKERVFAGVGRRPDLLVMQETAPVESESGEIRLQPPPTNRMILPSMSAPEHNFLKLLEESGM